MFAQILRVILRAVGEIPLVDFGHIAVIFIVLVVVRHLAVDLLPNVWVNLWDFVTEDVMVATPMDGNSEICVKGLFFHNDEF